MGLPPWVQSESQWFVLVTGANGGLGYSICERTIAEHFTSPSRSASQDLVIIVSTRSSNKTRDTIVKLRTFLRRYAETSSFAKQQQQRASRQGNTYTWQDTVKRVHFLGVELDLCDLRQIHDAAARIRGEGEGLSSPDFQGLGLKHIKVPRLDALVLNAGMIGIEGLRWGPAVWNCIIDTKETLTYWDHNIPTLGKKLEEQGILSSKMEKSQAIVNESEKEPPLGEVFCSNVFGHYILAHELMPLLHSSPSTERPQGDRGRIIWISSLEALDDSFDASDLQGLGDGATDPYRSTKRLTDILALTADLPSVRNVSASFFKSSKVGEEEEGKPEMYLAHPGICATTIVPLPLILSWCMLLAFYFARLLGSLWHPISTYKGAVAPSWLVLSDQSLLDSLEGKDGKAKWGSSTGVWGDERVRKTWVPGWGFGGRTFGGWKRTKGVKRGTVELTREAREDFESLGRRIWGDMEKMRSDWERILKK